MKEKLQTEEICKGEGPQMDFCIPAQKGSSFRGFLLLLVQSSFAKPGQQKDSQVQAEWQGYNKTGMVATWYDAAPATEA